MRKKRKCERKRRNRGGGRLKLIREMIYKRWKIMEGTVH
jgi:hypothetical protein